MSALARLARMFRVREDQAEDLLRSERVAKLALSRRTFLGAGAALASGTAFGFYQKLDHLPWYDPKNVYLALEDGRYNSYGRVAVARSEKGWDVKGDTARAVQPVRFPVAAGGDIVAMGFAIYMANGHRMFEGTIQPPIRILAGVTPVLTEVEITCSGGGELLGGTARMLAS